MISYRKNRIKDPTVKKVKKILLETTERPKLNDLSPTVNTLLRQWERLRVEDNILYRVWEKDDGHKILQLVVPRTLRKEIMQQLHSNLTAGLLGREETLKSVRSRFYWPGMSDDTSCWCETYKPCARKKPGPGVGKAAMHLYEVHEPLECIAIDIVGPLPTINRGNQYIMVVGDYFSKWKEAYPVFDHTAQTGHGIYMPIRRANSYSY
jgi:hypothetical protein